MKYAIIIADGASDEPIDELDGLTPLEAADTPNLDEVARSGKVGRARTTPPGFGAGSDVCSMSLLGYDPAEYHTGRAPLEAAALGLKPAVGETVFRVNLVTVSEDDGDDARMLDHSAGGIPSSEARILVEDLMAYLRQEAASYAESLTLTPGVSYRNILVDSSGLDFSRVETAPPHEIPDLPFIEHLPDGGAEGAAPKLCELIRLSREVLEDHEVNRARREQGLRPANLAWIWGQGTSPMLPAFSRRFEMRGAMTTAVDLLRGIARLIGWDLLDVPGATSYHDNDYAGQGAATIAALDEYDIVCCHVEAPDEASHQGDWKTKVAAIEAIDTHVIGPVVEKLRGFGDVESDPSAEGWRLLVLPDHATLCSTRKHDATPVPFAMAGSWVRSVVDRRMIESEAAASDLVVDPGHDLMEYFLFSGLKKRK